MTYYIKNKFKIKKLNKVDTCKSFLLRGFSLIEVVVTLAIFSILAGITYTSYPNANNIMAYNLTVQDIVARIKNAQIYGASQGGEYKGSGLYFQTSLSAQSASQEAKTIIEFLDKATLDTTGSDSILDSNKFYDQADSVIINPQDKILINEFYKNNIFVNKICTKNLTTPPSSNTCNNSSQTKLSITYIRPNTKAYITDMGIENIPTDTEITGKKQYDIGYIELKSKVLNEADGYRCIAIYKNGQINLKSGKCE